MAPSRAQCLRGPGAGRRGVRHGGPLDQWVEQGRAPDRVIAMGYDTPPRTRPLWPKTDHTEARDRPARLKTSPASKCAEEDGGASVAV